MALEAALLPTQNLLSNEARVLKHLMVHHGIKSDDEKSWIALCSKGADGSFKTHHYRLNEITTDVIKNFLDGNMYFSQNTFYIPWRKVENLRDLLTLYVDIDCYTMGFTPEVVANLIINEFSKNKFPMPNRITFSGQGLVPVWDIVPVPHFALPLWQTIIHHLVNIFKPYGADLHATDAARVFRGDGSTNLKNGQEVRVMYIHEERKTLDWWRDTYLPELPKDWRKQKKKGRPKKTVQVFNSYSLHYARLMDLLTLVELRKGKMAGTRELACFLYRYWQCDFTKDPELALKNTLEFNKSLKPRLSEAEVKEATKSAETMFNKKQDPEAREKARNTVTKIDNGLEIKYPDAGYNYRTSRLIKLFNITAEEQAHMCTLISKEEKQRRNTLKKREERGSLTREEYLEQQSDKTEDKLWELQKAMERHPKAKQKEIAEMLGISVPYVKKLVKKLKEQKEI
ncbi:winged helix-turn-helix transcriptional regulator [Peribacillus butanolivorans]|uniref:winged helix-turn-helix transcriptional regulator n=1 Tax=Peribacillus butanolivorans TaxID=421767 RepID=UPI0036C86BDB